MYSRNPLPTQPLTSRRTGLPLNTRAAPARARAVVDVVKSVDVDFDAAARADATPLALRV